MSGGVSLARLLDRRSLGALRAEALERHADARRSAVAVPVDHDPFRGDPERALETAPGGPRLGALHRNPVLLELLALATAARWRPAGDGATYSYYHAAGDHLGLHRDLRECALAVIVALVDTGGPGGALRLYPCRSAESLAAIRAAPNRGAVDVRLRPGEALILLGSRIPHHLLPVRPGQTRIVAPLCYQPAY